MKPGSTIETAVWLSGEETPEMLEQFRADVGAIIDKTCADQGILRAPVRLIEKRPGEDRVPTVPDHIHGPDVRLLVAEADIVGFAPETTTRRFVGDLDPRDLAKLRRITRRAYERSNPGRTLDDMQCDDVIETLGPDSAVRALRASMGETASRATPQEPSRLFLGPRRGGGAVH